MVVYRDSDKFKLYEDKYFDAPNWDETASSEVVSFTVKRYPFDLQQSGVIDSVSRSFRNNGINLSLSDSKKIASFTENYVNSCGLSPDPAVCMVLHGDRIIQVGIYKDKNFIETYLLEFIFEKFSGILTESDSSGNGDSASASDGAAPNSNNDLIPIGDLPDYSIVYMPFPDINNATGEAVVPSKSRYAVTLPPDTIIYPAQDNSRMVVKSTGKVRPNTVVVNKTDLDANEPSSALFRGTSHLKPQCICFVNNTYAVQHRGVVGNKNKLDEIRKAVSSYPNAREITAIDANGTPSRLDSFNVEVDEPQEETDINNNQSGACQNDNDNDNSDNNDNNKQAEGISESLASVLDIDNSYKRLVVLLD